MLHTALLIVAGLALVGILSAELERWEYGTIHTRASDRRGAGFVVPDGSQDWQAKNGR